jgi:hypothetical protein
MSICLTLVYTVRKSIHEMNIYSNRMYLPGGFKSVIPNGFIRNISSWEIIANEYISPFSDPFEPGICSLRCSGAVHKSSNQYKMIEVLIKMHMVSLVF